MGLATFEKVPAGPNCGDPHNKAGVISQDKSGWCHNTQNGGKLDREVFPRYGSLSCPDVSSWDSSPLCKTENDISIDIRAATGPWP